MKVEGAHEDASVATAKMPRKKSQSFADAFDDDCAKLSAKVDAQSESLHVMHVQRMSRDFKQLRTLNSEAVRLRSEIEQLTTDLQPRLERLAAKEAKQAVSAARMGLERVRDFGRADATKLGAAAAVKLQAKYRKKAAEPRHPLAHVHYCPESLRRNFLAGIGAMLPSRRRSGRCQSMPRRRRRLLCSHNSVQRLGLHSLQRHPPPPPFHSAATSSTRGQGRWGIS